MARIGGFLTAPLSETEYAFLKRVSGVVGTVMAVYLTVATGLVTALVILGLCLFLSIGLYKLSNPGPCLKQKLLPGR